MRRPRLAALIAAVVLACPGAAFAQSAGDEQYQDPFAGDDQGQSAQPETPPPASSGDTQTAQAAPAPTAAPTAAPAQASPAAQQLPRTGGNPALPAVAGFWLLLGGVALRARVRPRQRMLRRPRSSAW